jgi:hypothetical protein
MIEHPFLNTIDVPKNLPVSAYLLNKCRLVAVPDFNALE